MKWRWMVVAACSMLVLGARTLHWFSIVKEEENVLIRAHQTVWDLLQARAASSSLGEGSTAMMDIQKRPQLVFIKGTKVGGTTVAIALDRVARYYDIKFPLPRITEQSNIRFPNAPRECAQTGSLWNHHGFKSPWMEKCIPQARYTAVLRDPFSQTLSWEVFELSKTYYQHYPEKECAREFVNSSAGLDFSKLHAVGDLQRALFQVTHCRFTELRRNITMQLVAHKIANYVRRGSAGFSLVKNMEWMLGSNASALAMDDTEYALRYLTKNYFLIGVTERLNEFLLVLALCMGWDPATMYYVQCKQTDLLITTEDFARAFPALHDAFQRMVAPHHQRIHAHFKQEFDLHFAKLAATGSIPNLPQLLRDFNFGLLEYQRARKELRFPWKPYTYLDGHVEYC